MNTYPGQCHCGAVGFRYRTEQAPADWPVRACQCSFCRAHDVISTSHPDASIEFHVAGRDALERYRFGLRTADFLVCRRCGVYIGAVIQTSEGSFGIVNVRALSPRIDGLKPAGPAEYGGEDAASRIRRRERRWAAATLPGSA